MEELARCVFTGRDEAPPVSESCVYRVLSTFYCTGGAESHDETWELRCSEVSCDSPDNASDTFSGCYTSTAYQDKQPIDGACASAGYEAEIP